MPPKLTSWFHVEWSAAKELANFRKHGVRFASAMTVLQDPLALSRHDDSHDSAEERWSTLGMTTEGALLLAVHTFRELSGHDAHVRIISARRPTKDERWQYESGSFRIQDAVMKDEYDFSDAERGKFFREGAVFSISLELNVSLFSRLSDLATMRRISVSQLIEQMLTREQEAPGGGS
jgi:uncharacterized protein